MISQNQAVKLFSEIAGSRDPEIILAAGRDDCGAIAVSGNKQVLAITTDYTNFRPHSETFGIGGLFERARLLVLHNVSDLIATGVKPLAFVASVGVPGNFSEDDVRALALGLREGAKLAGIAIVGGDTKEAPQLSLCGTAVGMVSNARLLWKRSNGLPLDDLYLTGPVGGVSAAVWLLARGAEIEERMASEIEEVLMSPLLPLRLFRELEKRRFRIAAVDISDGLGVDLNVLADNSGVGMVVDGDRIPVPSLVRRAAYRGGLEPVEFAFGFGGDLQFAFTASVRYRTWIESAGAVRIGRLVRENSRLLFYKGGEYVLPRFGHCDFEAERPGERLAAAIGGLFGRSNPA